MDRHNVLVLLAVLFLSCTIPALSVSRAQAQGLTLEQLFAQAVRAEGLDYVSARNAIVERKVEALPFLRYKLSDPDWHARVIAEAIIGRIEDPEQYRTYEYYSITYIAGSAMLHVQNFYSLDYAVNSLYSGFLIGDAVRSRQSGKYDFGITGFPFLAELALKGSVLKKPIVHYQLPPDDPEAKYTIAEVARILNVSEKLAKQWIGSEARRDYEGGPKLVKQSDLKSFVNACLRPDTSSSPVNPRFRESARCWAMLKLGDCFNDDPATFPLLVELLQFGESTMIRGYAALALSITGKQEAIYPLTQAQNDRDEQVRDAAQRSLARLYRVMEAESKKQKEIMEAESKKK